MSRELPPGPGGPHYDLTEPRHAGPHYGPKCPGCRIHTEASEGFTCWTPNCPAHGLAADTAEAAEAAVRARRELSGRSLDAVALEHSGLDGMTALDMLADRMMLTVEIEHRSLE